MRIIMYMHLFPGSGRLSPSGSGGRLYRALLSGIVASLGLFLQDASAWTPSPIHPGPAGQDPPTPLLEVDLSAPGTWFSLRDLSLDFLEVRAGYRALVLGWPGTEERLRARGVPVRMVSSDYGLEIALRNHAVPNLSSAGVAVGSGNVPPFGQGSLAGFWTFDQVAALLDSLATHDPSGLVTDLDTLGWSVEGRPILALGVTDRSRPLGTRPEVLYTGLTHAREPEGMQVVLYFLLRLLQGYGSDPELTYLIQERELWFVPIVNPDGYVRNQNTWTSTGSFGLWRKNLRNNDSNPSTTSKDGVDLNRNFGFAWGYDDVGSSPDISSQIYRGPGPFSEPETQALRDFCLHHAFRTAENYHSFFEACLYPWGYVPADAPDSGTFIRLGDAMMEPAKYAYGRSVQILYPVNGEANDWMYGDPAKPRILSFTTEVGDQNDGFWPPASRILPVAQLNFHANVVLAYAASVYLTADSLQFNGTPNVIRPGDIRRARFLLRHEGQVESTQGSPTVHVTSGNPAVSVIFDARFPALSPGGKAWTLPGEEVVVEVRPETAPGALVPLYLNITDQGAYVGRDTLFFRVGEPWTVFQDGAGSGTGAWTTQGTWGVESIDGNPAFSDSPGGNYVSGANSSLTLGHDLNLTGAVNAVLRFRTQWDVETGFDFARVEASTDAGSTWTALAGRLTRPGHGTTGAYNQGTQPLGVPGYDGNQRFWADEEIDLGAYVGTPNLRLRFRLTSDNGVQQGGWLVDDIAVLAYAPTSPVAVAEAPPVSPRLFVAPNPLRGSARIHYALSQPSPVRLSIHDLAGREVRVLMEGLVGRGEKEFVWDGRDDEGRPAASGAYFVSLATTSGVTTAKLLVLR
jgi:carboxypeptidase T